MSDLRARLEASLSTTYRLERELGSGGMAVVYLAHDLRHKRRVALKVLRPEISAVIGPERFLREIETLANLTHPHILPLHDSGEANGLLYYVMPYVDGDSLRERLQREKQLPLDDALRIAREVADALSHAHGRGVIHRDIKPENILISGGHALVADFGIAAAIDVAADSRLTETGIAMGTPAYMSPEQALGKRTVDARTDIYALGCVLYEMLAGEPPFNGPTAQAMIARRLHEPIPSLRIIRDNVPLSIESALTKALARSPVDRFATAEHFAKALGKSGTAEPARGIVSRVGLRRIGYALSALALVAVVITFVSFVRSPEPAASLDDKLILVLPFRLVTDDSTLASHRQGSMELLTTKINATDVLRAVDPVQTLAALGSRRSGSEIGRTDARRLARQQGAASIVSGSIVVAQGRATVAVTFTEVANQRHGSVDVTGPVDSLNSLMDEIANKALLLAVGEREDRLQTLPTRSFPALKEYVAGVVAPTRAAGTPHFDQALRYDSTFALVALRLWDGATSTVDFGLPTEAFRLAFKARDKLSERDQDHLLALVGPRYPEESWVTERLQGIERALGPSERGELWVEKADWLFHQGGAIGMDKPLD
ncbi:MAG: serine/threonine-protein kinase, partial [Gemmatimonadota bacterium]